MTLKTRKPTGKPPWPMLLLAGAEKCGKSYSAAEMSRSDLIGRTIWFEVGEGAADQYGALPGARYEIAEYDGSFQQLLAGIQEAVTLPIVNGRPNAIVIDSMTEVWELLCNEQQHAANVRRKAAPGTDATITMDQWNVAKRRWRRIIDALRLNPGPVILTARFEQVTVMDKTGKPTADKEWKIRAEKNLPFEVDGIVEIPKPRTHYLNGMRSVLINVPVGGHMPMPDFSLDKLFRDLGLDQGNSERSYTAPKIDPNAGPVLVEASSGINRLFEGEPA